MKDHTTIENIAWALGLIEDQDRAAVIERKRLFEAHAKLRAALLELAPCLATLHGDDLATITARKIEAEEALDREVTAEIAEQMNKGGAQ
jgi:hypothetical protein